MAFGHQFTHLTREPDSLHHDDRLDSLGGAVADFADILGVDPGEMAQRNSAERQDEEWERLFGPYDGDDELGLPKYRAPDKRGASSRPSKR